MKMKKILPADRFLVLAAKCYIAVHYAIFKWKCRFAVYNFQARVVSNIRSSESEKLLLNSTASPKCTLTSLNTSTKLV